jgi:hypothetical protein
MKTCRGVEVWFHLFVISVLGGGGQLHAQATLPPPPRRNSHRSRWIGGWLVRRAGLDAVTKRKASNPGHPVCSLVTVLVELPGLSSGFFIQESIIISIAVNSILLSLFPIEMLLYYSRVPGKGNEEFVFVRMKWPVLIISAAYFKGRSSLLSNGYWWYFTRG